MAGAEAEEFRKASRTPVRRVSSCCGRCVTRSRPMHVSTKKRHSISESDRTGGLTQSSQHLPRTVSSTMGGGTPSHSVRSCNWRRFSWQNISVKKAINAVNRGRDGFLMFIGGPRTLSRSWYHWRHVFSRASRKVSFCSLAIIEMHNREIGRAYLRPSTARCINCIASSMRQRAFSWFGSSIALLRMA